MLQAIIETATLFTAFTVLDRFIAKSNWQNPYYAVHSIHNAAIVAVTSPDVYNTFTDLHGLTKYETNWLAVQLCLALHFYHIALYWQKFRSDDWLHHLLMIGVAIPIGCYLQAHTLMGFSLFFTTGLPGCVDYLMLFLVRNQQLPKYTEKYVNTLLNVWIRSPGCQAMAALTVAYTLSNPTQQEQQSPFLTYLSVIPALLNYWNGQYFMQQVVEDQARLGWIDLNRH
jgi:hypothetical protein